MWVYNQKTGVIKSTLPGSDATYQGYAGRDGGKNNPFLEDVHDVGPLPCGKYTIFPPTDSPRTGPYTMILIPDHDNVMFGRGDFRIHGDSFSHPGEASDGCIVTDLTTRHAIWNSGDRELLVVSGNQEEQHA